MNLSEAQIKEIAEQIDCGFICYIHKTTGEIISLPDTDRFTDMELDGWKEDIRKIKKNYNNYYEIEPISTRDSFHIMEGFANSLADSNPLKKKLFTALSRPKPFRHFKDAIDYSGEYRQKWFDYKNQWMIDWVKEVSLTLGEP